MTTPWREDGETAVTQGRRLLAELAVAGDAALAASAEPLDREAYAEAKRGWELANARLLSYALEILPTCLDLVESVTTHEPGGGAGMHAALRKLTTPASVTVAPRLEPTT